MTARIGAPKTGGRRKGSLDKGERAIVTSQMANDLLLVYKKLGGAKWLLEFAKANPGEFIRQGLSRLWPAPQKDDPDIQVNTQINVGDMSEREAAIRVAFALSKAVYEQGIDATPVQAYQPRQADAVPDLPPLLQPEPVEVDPDRKRWIEELNLSPEQRRDNALVRASKTGSLESYSGSSAEQGSAPVSHPSATTKRSAGELARSLSRRRRELL